MMDERQPLIEARDPASSATPRGPGISRATSLFSVFARKPKGVNIAKSGIEAPAPKPSRDAKESIGKAGKLSWDEPVVELRPIEVSAEPPQEARVAREDRTD